MGSISPLGFLFFLTLANKNMARRVTIADVENFWQYFFFFNAQWSLFFMPRKTFLRLSSQASTLQFLLAVRRKENPNALHEEILQESALSSLLRRDLGCSQAMVHSGEGCGFWISTNVVSNPTPKFF